MELHTALLQYCSLQTQLHEAGILPSPVVPVEVGLALATCNPKDETYSLLSINERQRIELEDQRSLNRAIVRAIQVAYRLLHEDVSRASVSGYLVEFLDADRGEANDMLVKMSDALERAEAEIASLNATIKRNDRLVKAAETIINKHPVR